MQCQAIKTAVYFLLLTTLLNSQMSLAQDWKLEKNKNSVSIFSQITDSGYKDILVRTIVDAPPNALIALLDDVAFSSHWIHNCIEVKILEEISPTERLTNTFFNAPWPVKDRDMVTISKAFVNENNVRIEISDRGNTTQHNPEYVRMQKMHGIWEAVSLESGKSEITYIGGGNPGGNLPTFIANRELISSMFNTFQNLNNVIILDRYQPEDPNTTSK